MPPSGLRRQGGGGEQPPWAGDGAAPVRGRMTAVEMEEERVRMQKEWRNNKATGAGQMVRFSALSQLSLIMAPRLAVLELYSIDVPNWISRLCTSS